MLAWERKVDCKPKPLQLLLGPNDPIAPILLFVREMIRSIRCQSTIFISFHSILR